MTSNDLVLRPLQAGDEAAARVAHDALAPEGNVFLLGLEPDESWENYISKLSDWSEGRGLYGNWVPSTLQVGVVDDRMVGRISIRHGLFNDFAKVAGGHIGYCVVPAERGKGYATEILRQGLAVAKSRGIDNALLTCDEGNAASKSAIVKNGGQFESLVENPRGGPSKLRFWIDTNVVRDPIIRPQIGKTEQPGHGDNILDM